MTLVIDGVSLVCESCGIELDYDTNRHGDIAVVPCKACAEDSYSAGYEDGKEAAGR